MAKVDWSDQVVALIRFHVPSCCCGGGGGGRGISLARRRRRRLCCTKKFKLKHAA